MVYLQYTYCTRVGTRNIFIKYAFNELYDTAEG